MDALEYTLCSRLIPHLQQLEREWNLCIGGRGSKMKQWVLSQHWQTHRWGENVCEAGEAGLPRTQGCWLVLSLCSCHAAGEHAISDAFEDENSYVFNCDGVLCSSDLGGTQTRSEALICSLATQANWQRAAPASLNPCGNISSFTETPTVPCPLHLQRALL